MFAYTVLMTLSFASPPADSIDHLRSEAVKPQIDLVIDSSGSMGLYSGGVGECAKSTCDWYWNTYGYDKGWVNGSYKYGSVCSGGKCSLCSKTNYQLVKYQMMQASLIGCQAPDDGILDRWRNKADFIIHQFASSASLVRGLGSTPAELKAGIMSIGASGSTNQTDGLYDAGKYMRDKFNNSNASSCTPFYIVMLSDGNPTAGGQTFNYECTAPVESKYVASNQPWYGSDYLQRNPDIMCSVDGDQNVKTYTIGFGKVTDFDPDNLQKIADYGGGDYYYASDAAQLDSVFGTIINEIVESSAVFFSPPAVQTEAFFSSNYVYSAAFRPRKSGPWAGTVKKFCVVPPQTVDGKYDTNETGCMFLSPDGDQLYTNPKVKDQWTGITDLSADDGGSGLVLFDQMQTTPGGVPKSPYWSHRNIMSWRDGESTYVPIDPTEWEEAEGWTNGCDHYRLVNFLHGYTFDADCSTGKPLAARDWMLGDPINAPPVLLKYGACESESGSGIVGNCYVVVGMNDGMLHIFDAANGEERSALIPAELWESDLVSNSILADINDQPSVDFTHRYYVDGGARLFHEDADRDTNIDADESAWLIFGLGRGGKAYYAVDVRRLPAGHLTNANNPIYPITPEPGSSFEKLQDTWAAPWVGLAHVDAATKRVAAFASGHVWAFDGDGDGGSTEPTPPPPPPPPGTKSVNCTGAGGLAAFNGLPDSWCSERYFSSCKASGKKQKPCYDSGFPIDVTYALTINDGTWVPSAFRVYYTQFDLENKDYLYLEDSQGNLKKSYTGKSLKKKWTEWVYDSSFALHFKTDGSKSNNKGYVIDKVEWQASNTLLAAPDPDPEPDPDPDDDEVLPSSVRPAVWLVDLDNFNGSPPQAFSKVPAKGAVLVQVAKKCSGPANDGYCVDATKSPDLKDMICPVSAELAVRTDNGIASAFYWGDECGQIWKAWTADEGVSWNARKLINLNSGSMVVDRDHRKIFRRLDLAHSSCPGRSVVAIYFGTGNVQRPNAKDELTDTSVTDGRDIIGVLWDYDQLPSGLTQSDLADATDTTVDANAIFAEGKPGWIVRLAKNERMLRDPLVFDSVAYFKTYEPAVAATTCGAGSGLDRIYALDNCSSGAAGASSSAVMSEREVWAGETEVGGGLFLFTPKDSPILVSHADLSQKSAANLNEARSPRLKLLLWRRVDR
ncbi:MAG: VWA domain-containing protein [Deltaproteobacteria bacterium]|nr:VWA domain-containing protein [Deltaproteobacteria bacterium]